MTEHFKSVLPFENSEPSLAENTFIASSAVVIGDVEIGKDSGIWYGCTVRGDTNEIRIGERSNVQDGSVIHVSSEGQGTYIGNDVTIGHMALIHACTLQDGCFIGMKACIMDGAIVETGAMVAAGALVSPGKIVKSGQVWAGVPAKYIRDMNDKDREMLTWTAAHYVELAQRHANS
jgi:carbonic anhydrase/acetyltransferase-like protein (isoleucine patch superfamily)